MNREYDGRGLLAAEGTPRFVTGLAGAFADWANRTTQPCTTYTYDGLRRPLVTTLPESTLPDPPRPRRATTAGTRSGRRRDLG